MTDPARARQELPPIPEHDHSSTSAAGKASQKSSTLTRTLGSVAGETTLKHLDKNNTCYTASYSLYDGSYSGAYTGTSVSYYNSSCASEFTFATEYSEPFRLAVSWPLVAEAVDTWVELPQEEVVTPRRVTCAVMPPAGRVPVDRRGFSSSTSFLCVSLQ